MSRFTCPRKTATPAPPRAVFPRPGASGGLFTRNVNGLIPTILDNGYNFDFTDDGVMALRGKVDGKTLAFGDSKIPKSSSSPASRACRWRH